MKGGGVHPALLALQLSGELPDYAAHMLSTVARVHPGLGVVGKFRAQLKAMKDDNYRPAGGVMVILPRNLTVVESAAYITLSELLRQRDSSSAEERIMRGFTDPDWYRQRFMSKKKA